jgi:hypothetical protein
MNYECNHGVINHDISTEDKVERAMYMIESVANIYKIEIISMFARKHMKEVFNPRYVAMYLCRKHMGMSNTLIGKVFDRNHSVVIDAIERVDGWVKNEDEVLIRKIDDIERVFYGKIKGFSIKHLNELLGFDERDDLSKFKKLREVYDIQEEEVS